MVERSNSAIGDFLLEVTEQMAQPLRLSNREYEKLYENGFSNCGIIGDFSGLCATDGLCSPTSSSGAGTASRSCHRNTSAAAGGSANRRSGSGVRLDAGLLGVAWRMGLGGRPLGTTAASARGLGGRPLGPTWPRLRLGWGTLALVNQPADATSILKD